MKKLFAIVLGLPVLFMSCTKLDMPLNLYNLGGGFFIINEGNFNGGNGSVSFYSYDSLKVFNDVFSQTNGRPLGDVPNSVTLFNDRAYIVVNNSGKIEAVNNRTMESLAMIDGLISPRNMAIVDDHKAYVTSMYSDSIVVLDLLLNTVKGYINVRRTTEAIAVTPQYTYVSNWVGGNEVMVINTVTDKVIDSIQVGLEPESMVIDRNNNLWILCGGGWMRENYAELYKVNTTTNRIVDTYVFPSLQDYPSSLRIDGAGQTLYFLDKGVYKMDIESDNIPASPFIAEAGVSFYKLGLNPLNGDIIVTDAADYVSNGSVRIYTDDGALSGVYEAGIIPGSITFKIVIE